MRGVLSARALTLACIGLTASACGYSSSGKDYYTAPPAPSVLLMHADLSGAAETTVVSATAKGSSLFEFHADGNVTFAVTAEASWVAGITGARIQRGPLGIDGPVEINLLASATFDPVTRTASGPLTISAALASEIIVYPSYFYVQITTSAAPGGFVRAQLAAATTVEARAVMRGSEESPVVDASARGAVTFSVGVDRTVHYVLAMSSPAISQIAQAHVHVGAAGVTGAAELDLATASAVYNVAAGTLTSDVVAPVSLLCRLALDPSAFYVDINSISSVPPVARGQLTTGTLGVFATLAGSSEISVVDVNARAGVTLELTSFTSGRGVFAEPIGIGAVTSATVRTGAAFVAGPSLIDLRAGADFATGTDTAEGAIALDQSTYARILANPAGFYAEIRTAAAPNGLARGQLGTDPVTFRATMLGTNELVVVNPAASGSTKLVMTGVHSASFDVTMTTPAANTLTGAHLHTGPAGVNGGIVIDFLSGTGITTTATHVTGDVTFTGRTLASLIAAPDLFYANVHTLLAPNGVARGQMVRVTDSSAPTLLTYTTPVVYVTSSPIVPNVPSNSGGAVASYAISPALSAGLSFNTTSGIISGTPTATAALTVYTVTASNTAGSTNANVSITVNVAAPTNLVYTTPVTYVNGTAIPANTPTNSGGAIASYTVAPALPAGLSLNGSTGVITGTPTVTLAAANYVVTGTNVTNSTQATINITVQATLTAPSGLSYSTPVNYGTGTAITPNTPTVGGGPVSSWSVSPALPTGLTLSTSTGVISGTPTVITAAATYTVTATNGAGFTTAGVSIQITLGAPTNLSYGGTNFIGYVSPPYFNQMNPSSSGGAVASYSVSPALPTGITLNTSTGVITGPPTATSAQTTYTVTATNASGTTQVQFTINVPY